MRTSLKTLVYLLLFAQALDYVILRGLRKLKRDRNQDFIIYVYIYMHMQLSSQPFIAIFIYSHFNQIHFVIFVYFLSKVRY